MISTIRAVTPGSPSSLGTDSAAKAGVGRVIGGRYRLLAPLGTGASATVYVAQDLSLQRRVAVKLLHPALVDDPKFRRRFRAEAQSAAQMSHPHLMAVHDWGDQDEAYLITELLPGGSLRQMIDGGYRLSPSQALVIGLHAGDGLAHAHERGFVHRDIKPANLLFGSDGRLRVADFGIARAVAEAAWTEPEGSLIGTARYAAPEQAAGSNVDGRADVYSLALTLIEGVTGEVPLVEATPLATMLVRQDQDVPRVEALGPLAAVVEAAGRVDRERRPSSSEFIQALNGAAGSLPRPKRLPLISLDEFEATLGELPDFEASQSDAPEGDGIEVVSDSDEGVLDVRSPGKPSVDLQAQRTDGSAKPAEQYPTTIEQPSLTRPESRQAASPDRVGNAHGVYNRYDSVEDHMDLEHPSVDIEADSKIGRRKRWPWAVLVGLLAVGGLVLVRLVTGGTTPFSPPPAVVIPTHPVGTFVGQTVEDATRDIELANLVVTSFERRQDGSTVGEILEQTPDPGTVVEEGTTVTLWISLGPELHAVPRLIGLTLADARASFAESGLLIGSVGNEFDEEAASGVILTASEEPGVELETGSRVDLVLSGGPAKRTAPDLSGLTIEAATAELAELGLLLAEAAEPQASETVAEGSIISSDIGVGESIDRDSTITVVVSSGLPFIQVPDIREMRGAEATTLLEDLGFTVVAFVGSPNKKVIATDPPIGEFHRKGTEITIFARGG